MSHDVLIILDPTPRQIDGTWGFEFTLPNGQRDHVSGHFSQREALVWLRYGGCAAWSRKRGYICDKCTKRSGAKK
jgi:hypothetical protein